MHLLSVSVKQGVCVCACEQWVLAAVDRQETQRGQMHRAKWGHNWPSHVHQLTLSLVLGMLGTGPRMHCNVFACSQPIRVSPSKNILSKYAEANKMTETCALYLDTAGVTLPALWQRPRSLYLLVELMLSNVIDDPLKSYFYKNRIQWNTVCYKIQWNIQWNICRKTASAVEKSRSHLWNWIALLPCLIVANT